jgi:hypothetical protein
MYSKVLGPETAQCSVETRTSDARLKHEAVKDLSSVQFSKFRSQYQSRPNNVPTKGVRANVGVSCKRPRWSHVEPVSGLWGAADCVEKRMLMIDLGCYTCLGQDQGCGNGTCAIISEATRDTICQEWAKSSRRTGNPDLDPKMSWICNTAAKATHCNDFSFKVNVIMTRSRGHYLFIFLSVGDCLLYYLFFH